MIKLRLWCWGYIWISSWLRFLCVCVCVRTRHFQHYRDNISCFLMITFQDLFRKVVPHHCLGSVWSRRDKKHGQAPSVYATVNHFNAVSYRVVATILKHPYLPPLERIQIIEKWIDIAQVSHLYLTSKPSLLIACYFSRECSFVRS